MSFCKDEHFNMLKRLTADGQYTAGLAYSANRIATCCEVLTASILGYVAGLTGDDRILRDWLNYLNEGRNEKR